MIFAPDLRRLHPLYSGTYAWGSTSTIGPLRSDYELNDNPNPDSGTHLDIFPFGGDTSPIWAHEHRET